MSLDAILWALCSVAEAIVIGLLIYRRVWRTFPIFFVYSFWTLTSGVGAYVIYSAFPAKYLAAYYVEMIVDSVLLFGVLVELGWSVVRPLRTHLSKRLLIIISGIILVLGAAIWPFAKIPLIASLPRDIGILMHLQQTFYALRVLVFLMLAGSSQLLSIGWRDRELQIATGLGFTSLVGLGVAMLEALPTMEAHYHQFNRMVVASYLCSLLYWIVSFSQQEAERREFTPQMQSLLLAVAGAARTNRIALRSSAPPDDRP